MPSNTSGTVDVPLSVFSGLDTELSPSDIPEGISPDNQDVVFTPGAVATRPGLARQFAIPISTLGPIAYQKSFVTQNGVRKNLYLTQGDQKLWVENVTTSPGTVTELFQFASGVSYASSVTSSFAEYIALSDGVHGQDVPIVYDGSTAYRLTQDGPGAPPDAASLALASSNLASYPVSAGGFVIIPVSGGGNVAIGAGNLANGGSIPLPSGFNTTNLVAWASPQTGFSSSIEVEGVYDATVTTGVVSCHFQKRDGTQGFASAANWAALAWDTVATVTVTTAAGITYVEFTTNEGDDLCIACGLLTTASPTMGSVPAGFSATYFKYIVGPATTDHSGHGLQQVQECTLDGTLTKTLTYGDRTPTSGNHWSGGVNVFGIFYKTGGGVTEQTVTNGTAIVVPASATESFAFIQANAATYFGLPSGFLFTSDVFSACAMATGDASADHVDHGWYACNITGQFFTGTYADGEGHFWYGTGNLWGIASLGTTEGNSLIRVNNTVTAQTLTNHNLQVGYLAQISSVPASEVGGAIVSISLVNADNPGIATITMSNDHGLLPDNIVTITGVTGTAVGGGLTSIVRAAQIVTATTAAAHGLGVGSEVKIAGVTTDTTFNGQFPVLSVPSPTTFTYYQFDSDSTSAVTTGATVTLVWPLANVDPALNYFTVQTAPTSTSFTVQLSYPDGTWTGGTVSFGWNGKFYVTRVISATSFEYQQYGPDASTAASGVVTPYGQITPGLHQVRVSFLLEDGSITAPSPPVQFVANGGQYVQLPNLPIGPAGTVGRILQFTGALGGYFFYLPVAAQVNGLIVSTSTVVNDNTSTSVILDFSDNTLYTGLGVSIPGNNLQQQLVLGPTAGMFSYASRLLTWGNRNKVYNLLNMGFEGGTSGASAYPLGWTGSDAAGTLVDLRLGQAWEITISAPATPSGQLSQNAYAQFNGASIIIANTNYTLRFWAKTSVADAAISFNAVLSSATTGFSSTATVAADAMVTAVQGSFVQADFSLITPATIPSDLLLTIYAESSSTLGTVTVDDLELIYTDQLYNDNQARISYAGNRTAFDGVTGIIGAEDDDSAIMNFGTLSKTLYWVTGTGLHASEDNQQTEPDGWDVEDIADNCGAFSIASIARDGQGIGGAGKRWMMWTGPDGAQIFFGQKPFKLSQEIQSLWDAIPSSAYYKAWCKNDTIQNRCYFGMPQADGTVRVYPLDYRNIDGEQLPSSPPVHISFTGKMISSDLTRKWSPWTVQALCGELMYRDATSKPVMVFGGGNASNQAQAYILDGAKLSDDDFGRIPAYYTTFFFVSHEMEQQLQVGSHRHQYSLAQIFALCTGTLTVTPYAASLSNPFPAQSGIPNTMDQKYDVDWGINVVTTRCAFKIEAVPSSGTDSYFSLQKMVINMAKAPWQETRGSYGGSF